jgi:ribosome-associated heat shock protein Hsp15
VRIDKLLWFLRLVRTRGAAQALVEAGHIRLNRRRIERASQAVAVDDIRQDEDIVLPLPRGVTVIELIAMPNRRGPAAEALSCYRVLDGQGDNPIAADSCNSPQGTITP